VAGQSFPDGADAEAAVATIDHVIVLALENRSFDHILGYLDHPDPGFDGLTRGGPYTNPPPDGGAPVPASPTAKPVLPADPDHSHQAVLEQLRLTGIGPLRHATNQGFVASYERRIPGRGPLAMLCQSPAQVPVMSRLALEFVACTRWFSSVPGETWPNRNFMHAATSDGETDIDVRWYTNPTIFELLEHHGKSWHIYHDDTPQVWAFPKLWDTPGRHRNWYEFDRFARHLAAGQLPAYSFIEPNHRPPLHTLDHEPVISAPDVSNNQHPGNNLVKDAAYNGFTATGSTDFSRGESLVATVYEALRANPDVFNRSLLLVTYDEHGGLYDHVPPPTDVPSPGTSPNLLSRILAWLRHHRAQPFAFHLLGPRVPALVISPYVSPGTVSTQVHDHASIPATVRALFAPAAAPLTRRDAWAAPFHGYLTLEQPRTDLPDLSAYLHPTCPATTRTSPSSPNKCGPDWPPAECPRPRSPRRRRRGPARRLPPRRSRPRPIARVTRSRPPGDRRSRSLLSSTGRGISR
jgi:phospholipase C